MKKTVLYAFFLFVGPVVYAQSVTVPSVIHFADMELRIHDRAREEIQNDVDALTRSQKYFDIKVNRVLQYFPIIERILREENVPDDFKYLVIQESALIPDAVSSSNAVGFWQFKESSGEEVGLRIDRNIDERMNIVSATRGACKYLKTNNFYFDNWVFALISYMTGRGGAEAHIDSRYFGSKKMEINKRTHWYVKKYLAHKIAFQHALEEDRRPSRYLYEYTDGGGKSLSEIANELNLDPDELQEVNVWVRRGRIPVDKTYTVLIPTTDMPSGMIARDKVETTRPEMVTGEVVIPATLAGKYPVISETDDKNSRLLSVNGIPGTLARNGDDTELLAGLGEISLKDFLRYNDIDITHRVVPGQVYYFRKKRNKAPEHYHTVYPGEDSWSISQKYGIKEKKLLRRNRIKEEHSDFEKGRIVWMRFIRPADHPVEYAELPVSASFSITNRPEESRYQQTSDERNRVETGAARETTADVPTEDIDYIDTHLSRSDKENEEKEVAVPEDERNEVEEVTNTSAPLFHVVQSGETLYGISRQYAVSLELLRDINDLADNSPLQIGQKVYLKDPFPGELSRNNAPNDQNSYIIYQVKRGETLYAISRKFDVSVDEIREWNQKNDNMISEGDLLKIKR